MFTLRKNFVQKELWNRELLFKIVEHLMEIILLQMLMTLVLKWKNLIFID